MARRQEAQVVTAAAAEIHDHPAAELPCEASADQPEVQSRLQYVSPPNAQSSAVNESHKSAGLRPAHSQASFVRNYEGVGGQSNGPPL